MNPGLRVQKKRKKSKCRRNIEFNSSEEEEDDPKEMSNLCDDDEMDDINPSTFANSTALLRASTDTNEVCLLCGEFGQDNELWYRCVLCIGWVHAACSGAETAENFICDFCKMR